MLRLDCLAMLGAQVRKLQQDDTVCPSVTPNSPSQTMIGLGCKEKEMIGMNCNDEGTICLPSLC